MNFEEHIISSRNDSAVAKNKSEDELVAELHALVMHSLEEDQAQEVVSIPLEGKSSIADLMVIASGRSTRQVAAIAQKLAERVKEEWP